jgi:hypothetical protein
MPAHFKRCSLEMQRVCPSIRVATVAAKHVHVATAPLLTLREFTDANVSSTEGQIVLNIGGAHDPGTACS